ncbi:MAG: ABC transporter substrate-binding protein, partial [Anaerovoracaceae bacterium]
ELVYADNASDVETAKTAATELIASTPAVVLGSYNSVYSIIAGEYFKQAEIPAIAATNTSDFVTADNPFYFRVRFSDSFQGKVLAEYAAEELKSKKAAILMPDTEDGALATSSRFSNSFIEATGDEEAVVENITYESGTVDFSEQIKKLKENNCDTLLLLGKGEESAAFINLAQKEKIKINFLGTETFSTNEFIKNLKLNEAANILFTSFPDLGKETNEMSKVFLTAYSQKYGDKVPNNATALAFDSYLISLDAITLAGSPDIGSNIAKNISEIKDFVGATGTISFTASGDPERSIMINKFLNGKIIPIKEVLPKEEVLVKNKEKKKMSN